MDARATTDTAKEAQPAAPGGLLAAAAPIVAGARVVVAASIAALVLRTGTPPAWDAHALHAYEPVTAVTWVAAAALGVAWFLRGEALVRAAERIPAIVVQLAAFVVALVLVRHMTVVAFHGFPQVQDEIAYDRLARHIARLDPVPRSHPLGEFFRLRFWVDDGRSYPVFQPGWPALLAIFHRLHAPTWAPAFASALAAVATARLADRLYGRLASILAVAILVCSPFFLFLGGAYFSHPLSTALATFTLERVLASMDALDAPAPDVRASRRRAIAAGAGYAWLLVTRAQIAVAMALPLAVVALARAVVRSHREGARLPRLALRRGAGAAIVAFTLVGSVGLAVQGAWNLRTTHRPFELPQDRYFALTESNPRCHRLGFGADVGCRREHGPDVAPDGFPIARAVVVHEQRWSAFRNDAWGTAIPIALVALALARRPSRRGLVLAAAIAAPIALSFAFYYHGISHGVRLWAEAMPPLVIAIASGLLPATSGARGASSTLGARLQRLASALGLVALVPLLVVGVAVDAEERAVENGRDPQAARVAHHLDVAGVHDAIVYVENCDAADRADVVYGWASVLNANPAASGDRWIVRDFGLDHDRQLVTMYPTRRHVRVDCNGGVLGFPNATPSPDWVVTEAEAKFPLDAQSRGYTLVEGSLLASNHAVLTFVANEGAASFSFRQWLPRDGAWRLTTRVRRRSDGGRLDVAIDGVALGAIDGAGAPGISALATGSVVTLAAGEHVVTLRAADGAGPFRTAIDRFEWSRER